MNRHPGASSRHHSADPARCHSHHEVAMRATEAKHQAKLQAGNSLFVDRRQGMNNTVSR
ncbi:MAG: hypothetical protein LM550_11435 [Candidatus Contendobacter sp.]|jgi:hypothetical protein|nr:hypothetical protein [Gammaproteobacteria bacterium]MCC8994275.1 hypothetical protein [Candidatus Contendobacter sp.]